MELNEALKDIISELITDEMIKGAISKAVDKKLSYVIDNEFTNIVREIIEQKGEDYIKEQIDQFFNGKEIRLDDGWGNVETYESFDIFVRRKMKEQLKDHWRIEERVRMIAESKVKETVIAMAKEMSDELVQYGMGKVAKKMLENDK